MRTLFWLAFALAAYTYAGYPLLIAALARLRPRPWLRSPQPLSVSVIMAVHNGAHLLPGKLDHLLALDPAFIREIVVISDGSRDDTATLLRAPADPRFQAIILAEQVGKAAALNHGIAAATSDILLFIDIRPTLAGDALPELLSNFADPAVGCVAGELVLSTPAHDAAASAVSGVYWRYEQAIRNAEAAVDSPVGVYGGFYAIRRALATPFPPGLILDDMFQPLAVIRQGYRSVLDRNAVVHDTWPGKVAGEFQRKVRTLSGNYQLLHLAPWVLSRRNRVLFQLLSHKLLRLVIPFALLALLLTSIVLALSPDAGGAQPVWATTAAAQGLLWTAALLSLRIRLPLIQRYAAAAGALLVLNAAAVAGLWRFLFTPGPLWKTWSVQPAANSSRSRAMKEHSPETALAGVGGSSASALAAVQAGRPQRSTSGAEAPSGKHL